MRQTELRLRALAEELADCRRALRQAVDRYEREKRRREARRRRLAGILGLVCVLVAGVATADTPSFGARGRTILMACGPAGASLTDASLSVGNATVTASFTVRPGCSGTTVTLASYQILGTLQQLFPQTLFDSSTQTFDAGPQTLTVSVPHCIWQVDLMTGTAPPTMTADMGHGTTVIGATGGQGACHPSPPPTTTTPTHTTTAPPPTTTHTTTTPPPTTTTHVTTTTPPPTTTHTTTIPPTTMPPATTTPPPQVTTTTQPPPTTTASTPPPPSPTDVAVMKVPDRTSAIVGQRVSYTLTVVNNGPADANDVVLVDPVPSQESLVSVSDSACSGRTVITCSFGTLAVGASRSVTVVALARSPGIAVNVATVTTTTPETNTANNQATARVKITGPFVPPGARCAALSLTHGKLLAGHATSIVVTARGRAGAPVRGVRVAVRGPGVRLVEKTNARGRAVFSLTPAAAGVLRIALLQAASCPRSLQEASVPGAFTPPNLTG